MFKTTERALKKEKYHVLLVKSSIMSKKRIKKNKGVVSKAKKSIRSIKKDNNTCHHYGKKGNWRRNYNEYFATVKIKKLNEACTLSMFVIENYLTTLHCSS